VKNIPDGGLQSTSLSFADSSSSNHPFTAPAAKPFTTFSWEMK
jgi:hypothetical protein